MTYVHLATWTEGEKWRIQFTANKYITLFYKNNFQWSQEILLSDPTYNELLPGLYAFGCLLNFNAVAWEFTKLMAL